MQVSVGAGTYVVAVSGGVDSMVLLDLLIHKYGVVQTKDKRHKTNDKTRTLIVAHFDHGMRPDSDKDRKLVQSVAKKHGLVFVYENGELGAGTSSAAARKARYTFLHKVVQTAGAKAIITAHHQDDVLETAILNLLRGSGHRGLISLKSTDRILRPLLGYTKEQLKDYAESHKLQWREDSSNATDRYKRNYVRHHILPKFSPGQRAQLLILLEDLRGISREIDYHLINLLHAQPALTELDRSYFILLPHKVANELLYAWLKRHDVHELSRKMIERLIVAMKTAKPGRNVDVDANHTLKINRKSLLLMRRSTHQTKKLTEAKIKS